MTFEELYKNNLTQSDVLWRYLSLHKYISLITKRVLLFSRLDLFQDPFEGIATRSIKKIYMARRMPNEDQMNNAIPQSMRNQVSNLKKSLESNYEKEALIKQKTQYINCWFKGERESMAMWNLYSSNTGVAIKINGQKLVKYFNDLSNTEPELYPDCKFICSSVKYYRLNPIDLNQKKINIKYSALKKDESYKYENEYRFLIKTPESGVELNTALKEIIVTNIFFGMTEVICHPEMPEWQIENIKKISKTTNFKNINKSEIELR